MATTDPPTTYRVLIPIYENFNTLDVHAPCEVLGNAAFAYTPSGTSPFAIQIAAEDTSKPTLAYEQVSTQADLTFEAAQEAIEADQVDILLVPGAGPGALTPAMENVALLNLIKAFINRPATHPRTLISICTGAVLCGVAGAFAGKTVTTHWATLELLKMKAPHATVVRKRWVDGGIDSQTGLHVISSGGISCGIDACLYFVGQQLPDGTEMAINIAQMMDYDWKAPHLGLQPSQTLMTLGSGLTPTSWTTNQWYPHVLQWLDNVQENYYNDLQYHFQIPAKLLPRAVREKGKPVEDPNYPVIHRLNANIQGLLETSSNMRYEQYVRTLMESADLTGYEHPYLTRLRKFARQRRRPVHRAWKTKPNVTLLADIMRDAVGNTSRVDLGDQVASG